MKRLFTLMSVLACVCQISLAQNYGILLYEDFESGVQPTGWTQSVSTAPPTGATSTVTSDGWAFGQTGYSSTYWTVPPSIDASQFAIANDDPVDQDRSEDWLKSPVLNLTHFDSAVFLYDVFYDGLYSASAYFTISYDAGATWLYLPINDSAVWAEDGVVIPNSIVVSNVTYTFNDQMMVGFLHSDNGVWGSGFAVDNVIIAGYNNPCDDIVTISGCASPQTVSLGGQGVLDFNFTSACGWSVPGAEQLYSFTPSTTGIHYMNITAATGASWLDYMYKPASSGCDTLGWTCMVDADTTGSFPMNLTAGVEYLILVDNEFADTETQTFEIQCPCLYLSGGNTAESEACGSDSNGGCNASPEAYESISCGGSVSGTLWSDGGSRDTDWYELVVTEQTTISINFSSGQPVNLLLVDDCTNFNVLANGSSVGCGTVNLSYSAAPGTYLLVIAPTSFESIPCGSGSANNYDITATFCNPPANDVCTGAISVACNDVVTGSTEFPVTNTDELDCVPGAGVWYVFSGDGSVVTFSTDNAGTDFDTRIGYTDGCGNACIDFDDDGGTDYVSGWTSVLTIPTQQGTDYYLYVGGYQGTDVGNFELSVTCTVPPSNDDVCNATAVSMGANGPFSNLGASAEGWETDLPTASCSAQGGWCVNPSVEASVWFSFVAPASGNLTVSTDGSSFDTQVAVYGASTCQDFASSSATLLGANDDDPDASGSGGSTLTSKVFVCGLTPGSTYYVLVDGYGGATGDISLTLTETTVAAGFTYSAAGLTVDFTDASTASSSVAGYDWDFGDGNTSTVASPSNTYASSGPYTVCLTVTDEYGCESQDCQAIQVDITTGIGTIAKGSVTVYPNPSNGQFMVELNDIEGSVQFNVVDVTGRGIYTATRQSNGSQIRQSFDLNVSKGTYLLQILTASGTVTHRIEVQ
ncbi:MAG: T9SS type A sorting domain-containing protein [Flavobacteriales bacterium]|nr:T9SS type A sorting domain-containing protein [Flavobacteriales bacterium]